MGRRQIRALLKQARALAAEAMALSRAQAQAEADLDAAAESMRQSMALGQLEAVPLERLRPLVEGRIAWSALADDGYRTVADVVRSTPGRLNAVYGVGEHSAEEVSRAAAEVYAETLASVRLSIRLEAQDVATNALISAAVQLDETTRTTRTILAPARRAEPELQTSMSEAKPADSLLRWLFASRGKKEEAKAAATRLQSILEDPALQPLRERSAARTILAARSTEEPRQLFAKEPARYLSLLDSRVGGIQSVHGDLDQAVVSRIEAIELDTSLLSVMLRRYQSFGARFVLAQERVILGDDMGLGKTIQALAVMAHLASEASSTGRVVRFLVIAPASVLINWEREVAAKSDLPVLGLHGSREAGNLADWEAEGGVAITTFEYTAHLPDDLRLDLLVVDEAHYVKNPSAQRTQRVSALAATARRVMMMTGTPIENSATEFIDLISMVNPELGGGLFHRALVVNPLEFRAKVAPVYLRRNAIDVLSELPDRIEIDEWEEMTDHDEQHYLKALESGNFMAIRRAGFAAASIGQSAKMNRLLEIVDEAAAAGHKVIVYSYFLDVLTAVCEALSDRAFGPMTGGMAPKSRQALVDEFTQAPTGSVLVSQVVAGGVGLNIQAASIVIMCEPQLKPSTENQAIARAHRMGQLKSVKVYRLLNPESIDERIEEILHEKEITFGTYARDSELAAAAGDALDSRTVLTLIQGERERRGIAGQVPELQILPEESS